MPRAIQDALERGLTTQQALRAEVRRRGGQAVGSLVEERSALPNTRAETCPDPFYRDGSPTREKPTASPVPALVQTSPTSPPVLCRASGNGL